MKKPFNPDVEILHYCEHICNSHTQVQRTNKDTGTWYRDYPAMATICHDRSCREKRASYSHRPNSNEYNTVLKKILSGYWNDWKETKFARKEIPHWQLC